nr:nucleotidyl transferase AbiEii/AbiGii toxin family protein [Ornithinimicrobium sp. HY1745]
MRAAAQSARDKTGKPAPTQELLTRHVLESFLDRLSRTEHAQDFILKGGILLAVYGARRATKDVDANAVGADVTSQHLSTVVEEIAAVEIDDGVRFRPETITVQDIREQAEYPGFRIKVMANVASWAGTVAWDVSTGDPIVPAPRLVKVPRVLGEPIEVLGCAPETVIAEKGVTILERGITSTRWRDYIDIVQLAQNGVDAAELRRSAEAVARHRQVTLEPVSRHLQGYGDIGQVKWAAWRRKQGLESASAELLDDQVGLVAAILDPIFNSAQPST